MKINLYLKSTFIDIKQSLGRFIAVVLIILMGVLLFVGIKSVGPNLEKTADRYFDKSHLSDIQVLSTLGLTEKDQQLIASTGAKTEGSYQFAYAEEKNHLTIQVISFNKSNKQNQLQLTSGRLPQNNNEVVIDKELMNTYSLNEEINITSEYLHEKVFKVVGFVETSLYMDVDERGATTLGDGVLDGFIYIPEAVFNMENYAVIYVTFDKLASIKNSFSKEYQELVDEKVSMIEKVLKPRRNGRLEEIKAPALEEIMAQRKELETQESQLATVIKELNQGLKQLTEQMATLETQEKQLAQVIGVEAAKTQLSSAHEAVNTQKKELENQLEDLTKKQTRLVEGQKELDEAQADVEELQPASFMVNDRRSNPGFMEYQSLSERIDAIANVFPVFFFAIAILITFTTISRMVEENRREIGTLKALGYRDQEIASKYILYTVLAAFLGTSVGILIGSQLLPKVVFKMQAPNNIFQHYTTQYFFWPICIAILAALGSTLGSALFVLNRDLKEKPTDLLIGKAPKAGKRVFLEKIAPIWQRLNFFQKVTYRNIFRYKARMVLTILGIAGCTGLIIAGFGLQDSISAPVEKQFNELTHYQSIVTLSEDLSHTKKEDVLKVIQAEDKITDYLPIYANQVTIRKPDFAKQTASFFVLDEETDFSNFITLRDATLHKAITLNNQGAFISQRLAKAYDLKIGSSIEVEMMDGKSYTLNVAQIVENYLGHTLYVSKDYMALLNATLADNTLLLKTAKLDQANEAVLAEKLLDTGKIINTSFISAQIEKQDVASESLGAIVVILIVLSGTLAFVVLYNLTNINISERERELATIKVLGFYDKEVTMHIVRENIVFTLLGILLGFGVGRLLTWFILEMASSDMMVFPMIIRMRGYVIAALMTAVFSAIVMLVTHKKLKNINMIEALKSNE